MLGLQAVFASCLFLFINLSYLAPVILNRCLKEDCVRTKRRRLKETIASYANCTSAGIFMALCFLGLFPSVRQQFASVLTKLGVVSNFPLMECVVVAGFFITLTVEQLFITWQSANVDLDHRHSELELREGLLSEFELGSMSPCSETQDEINQGTAQSEETNKLKSPAEKHRKEDNHHSVHRGHSHMTVLTQGQKGMQFLVLILATSVHAIFEGITLALQATPGKAMNYFIAILIHECLVGLALGISTSRLQLPVGTTVKFALMFSTSLPVGIAIGLALGRAPGNAGSMTSAIVQGIAAGTFLHVTFQEIIPTEFSLPNNRLSKLLFLLVGFILYGVLMYFVME